MDNKNLGITKDKLTLCGTGLVALAMICCTFGVGIKAFADAWHKTE